MAEFCVSSLRAVAMDNLKALLCSALFFLASTTFQRFGNSSPDPDVTVTQNGDSA